MKNFKYLLFSLVVVLIYSCSKTDEDVVDLGYDYYPLQTGSYIKYDVFEKIYDDFGDSIYTIESELLELVGESFLDGEGRTVYYLERYKRDDKNAPWQKSDVWTVYKGNERVERVEENVTLVKMTFPLRRGNTWDGNARNDSASQTYTVLDYDFNRVVGGTNFKNTSNINQKNNINLIEEQFAEEIYARDIGLVKKVERNITIDPSDNSKGGYENRLEYSEHGMQ